MLFSFVIGLKQLSLQSISCFHITHLLCIVIILPFRYICQIFVKILHMSISKNGLSMRFFIKSKIFYFRSFSPILKLCKTYVNRLGSQLNIADENEHLGRTS